jgi:hypothetical protein
MQAYRRSLQQGQKHILGEVDQVQYLQGKYIATIDEVAYSAIYNPFVDAYFVDDVDGRLN